MDDVNNPNEVVTNPGESETPAPSTAGENQTGNAPGEAPQGTKPEAGEVDWTVKGPKLEAQIENLTKALRLQRSRQRNSSQPSMPEEGGEDVFSHPAYQSLALKTATYELKEGAKEVLDRYPQVPKAVANAILKNPRGWVNEGTADVESALLDIEENLITYLEDNPDLQDAAQAGPKTVPVVPSNTLSNPERDVDVEIDRIQKTPPDEWSEADEKLVNDYLKRKKKK